MYHAWIAYGEYDEGICSRDMPLDELSEWISAVIKGISRPEVVQIRIYAANV